MATAKEYDIICRYAQTIEEKTGKPVVIEDNGCDNTGEFLDDFSVSTEADYKINGEPYEVKFIDPMVRKFCLKKDQVKSYIRQNATIILVNGYATTSPKFTIITVDQLIEIQRTKSLTTFARWDNDKKVYELIESEFEWELLPKHTKAT